MYIYTRAYVYVDGCICLCACVDINRKYSNYLRVAAKQTQDLKARCSLFCSALEFKGIAGSNGNPRPET